MGGHTPAELAREFEVSAQSVTAWVARAAADSGKPVPGKDVLSTVERDELARLRRQVRQLQHERDILAKANGVVRRQGRQGVQGAIVVLIRPARILRASLPG